MRELTAFELALVSGGFGECEGDGEEIIVCGDPPTYPPPTFPPSYPPPTYPPGDTPYPGGGGGGSSPVPVAPHPGDCGTPSGAAVGIAQHVMGTTAVGPPNPLETPAGNDWTQVEFTAIITQNPDGSYGALNDQIYSNDAPGSATNPAITGTSAVGIWHNHPDRAGNDHDAIDRYPSVGESLGLAQMKSINSTNNPAYDPSIFITAPDGVTREFKLSERAAIEALSTPDKVAGTGLAGKERSQTCS